MGIGRPVGRRNRDSGWQWLFVGMTLGVGCSFAVFLGAYVLGIIEPGGGLDQGDVSAQADDVVVVVTSTPEPITPSPTPEETVEVAEADDAVAEDAADVESSADETTPTTEPASDTTEDDTSSAATPLPSSNGGGASGIVESQTIVTGTVEATQVPIELGPTRTPGIGQPDLPTTLLTNATPLVLIPGGSFTMGTTIEEGQAAIDLCINGYGGNCTIDMVQDAVPPHQVTLDDFQMEIYEVSATQYVAFLNFLRAQNPDIRVDRIACGGNPCVLTTEDDPQSYVEFTSDGYELVNESFYFNHPITYVTWWGAQEYCETIGRRLPTEAEWERAARGTANSVYPWGAEWIETNANTSRPTADGTLPVDSYASVNSAYGALNMAGNVSEWVFDYYQSNFYTLPQASGQNPRNTAPSDKRVARGGGWDNVPLFARTVHRIDIEPGSPRGSVGFRCAADAPQ